MNPYTDRPASYVADSQRLSYFMRALLIPLVVTLLHLLAGCETTTTYAPDGGKTVIRKADPAALRVAGQAIGGVIAIHAQK